MRKILKYITILFLLLTLGGLCYSQTISIKKAWKIKKTAQKAELKRDYFTAAHLMEQYCQKYTDKNDAKYYLATLYYKSKQYEKALNIFSQLFFNLPEEFPLAGMYSGIILMQRQDYSSAITQFSRFIRYNKKSKDNKTLRKLASAYEKGCYMALQKGDTITNATVISVGKNINTPHIEFSPLPLNDTLVVFGSFPADSIIHYDANQPEPVRKLYLAQKNKDTWENLGELPWGINHAQFHTGNACLSPDKQRLYFTWCSKNWQYKTICHIYVSHRTEDKQWSEPQKLNNYINSNNYTSTMPTVGSHPKKGTDILYFASDRIGGKGGMDIWYSIFDKKENDFKEVNNAGFKINSVGDEITPYYRNEDQTLYFSSNGIPGYGGMDIFKSTGWGRRWVNFYNLDKPINSSYDDVYYTMWKPDDRGYLVSNRPGSIMLNNEICCDDLFYFELQNQIKTPVFGKVFSAIDHDIYDLLVNKLHVDANITPTGNPLNDVKVDLYMVEDEEQILVSQTSTNNGQYQFNIEPDKNYAVNIHNFDASIKALSVNILKNKHSDTLRLDTVFIRHIPPFALNFNIYYDLNSSKLNSEGQNLLDSAILKLLEYFSAAVIEIGSHTDDMGSDEFNMRLSQKRAESVLKYLVSKGINKNRLIAKGYGSSQPVAPNQLPDGTDNPEGRKLNRRTEIKIIGSITDFLNIDDE